MRGGTCDCKLLCIVVCKESITHTLTAPWLKELWPQQPTPLLGFVSLNSYWQPLLHPDHFHSSRRMWCSGTQLQIHFLRSSRWHLTQIFLVLVLWSDWRMVAPHKLLHGELVQVGMSIDSPSTWQSVGTQTAVSVWERWSIILHCRRQRQSFHTCYIWHCTSMLKASLPARGIHSQQQPSWLCLFRCHPCGNLHEHNLSPSAVGIAVACMHVFKVQEELSVYSVS